MWQSLYEELAGEGLSVIAVATDRAAAARPWIEAARPTYPCLIDEDHYLTDLYHLVNVPQSVWIDESGMMVRPPGSAGSSDGFRQMNRTTGSMPEAVVAERAQTRQRFLDAVRDWVRRGPDSPHALTQDQFLQRLRRPDPAIAEAHALFRLGQYLLGQGQEEEALVHWRRATELHPASWTMYRQHAEKNATGLAASPEFWARVDRLGDQPYHLPFE